MTLKSKLFAAYVKVPEACIPMSHSILHRHKLKSCYKIQC